jgi:phage terminase Nu1 subunit (DNA packaging protein)
MAKKKKRRAKTKPRATAKRKPSKLGSLTQCSVALHLGDRQIQRLVKDGLPRADHGRYDVDKCLRWYVRYLQKKLKESAFPDPDGGHTASIAIRHRLLTMEAELRQLDLAEKRGLLISIEKVGKDLASLVLDVKTRLLAISPRLAGEVIGEKEVVVVQDKIERALHEALIQLSQFTVENIGAAGPVSARR